MRAERMLQEAEKINCRSFVSPNDVVQGNYKLNLAFVANLFNNHPGLDNAAINEFDFGDFQEETREEKSTTSFKCIWLQAQSNLLLSTILLKSRYSRGQKLEMDLF